MIILIFIFFFKQKTAYEMRISDWSSDVCSSDLKGSQARSGLLPADRRLHGTFLCRRPYPRWFLQARSPSDREGNTDPASDRSSAASAVPGRLLQRSAGRRDGDVAVPGSFHNGSAAISARVGN